MCSRSSSESASRSSPTVADVLDLGLQAKQAHWNVKGAALDRFARVVRQGAEELEKFTDEVAEHAVELGIVALGTVEISKQSRLGAYPLNISSDKEHVPAMSNALAKFGASSRTAIDPAGKAGDADATGICSREFCVAWTNCSEGGARTANRWESLVAGC